MKHLITFFVGVGLGLVFFSPVMAERDIFPDVNDQDWFSPYVQEVVNDGVMQGYPDGRFGSWDPINRAELAKVLVNYKHLLMMNNGKNYLFEAMLLITTLIGWMVVLSFVRSIAHQQRLTLEALTVQREPEENPRGSKSSTPPKRYLSKMKGKRQQSHSRKPLRAHNARQKNQNSNWWH